ncbi:hypothetical protein EYF80_027422 [Liparis tanakae]|uniref:Uncharacterized protein n=1 Tax=Liparis tanakae TaxID=230148 RepID=A0A4Z2HC56_9TELE|nr:hypothetical protein EYF80_027422 [Liparis tanakae]
MTKHSYSEVRLAASLFYLFNHIYLDVMLYLQVAAAENAAFKSFAVAEQLIRPGRALVRALLLEKAGHWWLLNIALCAVHAKTLKAAIVKVHLRDKAVKHLIKAHNKGYTTVLYE